MSKLRTALRKVRLAKGRTEGRALLRSAYAVIDRSAKSGLIHKNTAANKKSRLSKFVASLPE
jgi:small subunit ribosomal protein S20